MHPILARGRFALYLGSWVLVGSLLGVLLATRAGFTSLAAATAAVPLSATYAFVCLSAWYVARSLPLSTAPLVRILGTALTASLLSSLAWLVAARLWIGWLSARGWAGTGARDASGLDAFVFGLGMLLYLLSLAVSYLLITFEETRDAERRALRGQVLAREAELRSLRTQIDPHFLFNSLHSISALTTADPAGARKMCLLLAEFLRASLAFEGESHITLGQELGLVERFLAVERVRFGDRLQAEIHAGEAGGCLVPPLILQPLVENAITHGVSQMLDGGTVTVRASRTAAMLNVIIENPCDPDRPRKTGTGVGLANVRARLRTLHGGDGRVDAVEANGIWRVELSMPAVTEPS